ncbi:MAG: hypothetical protein ACLRYY_12950 [Anaerobutyricum soehngenii]
MADLPQSFLDSMKEILGEDYEAFLTRRIGGAETIWLWAASKTFKGELEEFEKNCSFSLKKFRGFQMDIFTTQRMFQQSILFIVQGFIIYRSQVP